MTAPSPFTVMGEMSGRQLPGWRSGYWTWGIWLIVAASAVNYLFKLGDIVGSSAT